jgi:hypothetical protein
MQKQRIYFYQNGDENDRKCPTFKKLDTKKYDPNFVEKCKM